MNFDGVIRSSSNPPVGDQQTKTVVSTVARLMEEADKTPHIGEKRNKYNEAYKEIRKIVSKGDVKLPPEIQQQFLQLIELYASKTWYNHTDDDEGFRRAAHLCEFAICQLFRAMGIDAPDYEWEKFEDLDSLAKSLELTEKIGEKTIQKGRFFDYIAHLNVDERALAEKTPKELRKILGNAFLRLSFSLQNIDATSKPSESNHQLHHKLNNLTEAIINDGTDEQKNYSLYFAYNRCGFMIDLRMEDVERKNAAGQTVKVMSPEKRELKVRNYDLLEQKVREVIGMRHPDGISMVAQVLNQKGLLSIDNDDIKSLEQALPYFRKALDTRIPLLSYYVNNSDDVNKLKDQEKLVANSLTGFIHCLVKGEKVTPENLADAQEAAEHLKEFIAELIKNGDKNTYNTNWQRAINKVNEAKVIV